MPAVIRKGVDKSAGHCFSPRPADTGSRDVIINGIGVVRVGDHYPTHICGIAAHDGHASEGSQTVFANGRAVTRIADAISCGDTAAAGSPNVFAG